MGAKRVLLMHISSVSGHHSASLAIEKALRELDREVQICNINAFNYFGPYWETLINGLYMFVLKAVPQLWDYLYDNEDVLRRIRKLRSRIHRINGKRIKRLFEESRPDIVVCTQAFPCGLIADYKRQHNLNIPLIAVLTDYVPHLYWINDLVDSYVVPALKVKQKLIQRGVAQNRVKILGIPIDNKFNRPSKREEVFKRLNLNPALPVILIMGGNQGLGPIKKIVHALDKIRQTVQLIAVCGTNNSLYKWLKKNKTKFTKPISVVGHTDQIEQLMSISNFIVTKPGGLSSAEALSKSLPIIIVRSLPGQESRNMRFLLETGAALKADSFVKLRSLAEELLSNTAKFDQLRKQAKAIACSDSALKIAQHILCMTGQPNFKN